MNSQYFSNMQRVLNQTSQSGKQVRNEHPRLSIIQIVLQQLSLRNYTRALTIETNKTKGHHQ